jgi:hypothetical protein
LRRRGTGVAGFRNFMPSWMRSFLGVPDYPAGWVGLPGFANGSAGVGLALLAATTDAGAAWDRALLLSHR